MKKKMKRKAKALGRAEMKKISGGFGCEREDEFTTSPGLDGDSSITGRFSIRKRVRER